MALSGLGQTSSCLSASRGEADIHALVASTASVVNDPKRSLSANLFCTAKIYSFDQFVRAQQESLGDGEADGLCGLDVNHQLELGRELHRQLAYLGAAQDAVDVRCGPAIPIKLICCVCQKPARGDVGPTGVDRGQPVLDRKSTRLNSSH